MPSNKSAAVPASPKKPTKVASALKAKHQVLKNMIGKITKDQKIEKKIVEARAAVNSQVVMRGIAKSLKNFGNNPISILAKNSVKKGILLKPTAVTKFSKVSKKTSRTRKDVSKALNNEISKLVTQETPALPSEVKAKNKLAAVKISVNTEVYD